MVSSIVEESAVNHRWMTRSLAAVERQSRFNRQTSTFFCEKTKTMKKQSVICREVFLFDQFVNQGWAI